jgi:hypothetical protein
VDADAIGANPVCNATERMDAARLAVETLRVAVVPVVVFPNPDSDIVVPLPWAFQSETLR